MYIQVNSHSVIYLRLTAMRWRPQHRFKIQNMKILRVLYLVLWYGNLDTEEGYHRLEKIKSWAYNES